MAKDDTTVIVDFTGFCGGPTTGYHAGVREDRQHVSIAIFGDRPYSNLCEAQVNLTVHLTAPLGRRVLTDQFPGSHPTIKHQA